MKLILSERELEIIKQGEYKKGWKDCVNNLNLFTDLNKDYCSEEIQSDHNHKWIECFGGNESAPILLCTICNLTKKR
jgi:hypothetical protein